MTTLKRIREMKEITQNDIADRIGVSVRQYQRYENGKVPPVIKAKQIAIILNYPLEKLF